MSQHRSERPTAILMLLLSVLTPIAVAVNMAMTLKMAPQAANGLPGPTQKQPARWVNP